MNLFTPSLTGTEGSWIAEKKKNRQNTKNHYWRTVQKNSCLQQTIQ